MMWVLLALMCWTQGEPSEDIKVDYTATVTMVNLPIKVRKHGHPYKDLDLEQLRVVENGIKVVPQDLRKIETPITLHYLFDLSTSNSRHIMLAKRSVKEMVSRMRQGDKAKVSFFSSQYQPLTPYTSDKKKLNRSLGFLTPVGSTALYDSLAAALEELRQESGARMLILYSDGHDLMSHLTETELLARVKNYGIPIVFVGYKSETAKQKPLLAAQTQFMKTLANDSGGAVMQGLSAYQRPLVNLINQQRERYMLRYIPPGPEDLEQWRSLIVSVKNCTDCTLEYRRAYRISALK